MTKLGYISGADGAADRLVGKGNTTYADTLNKAVRDLLTLSGVDPDADFAGFLSLAGGTMTGLLNAAGGVKGQVAVRKVAADYTLTADDQLLIVDAATGSRVVTVPASSSGRYGWSVVRSDNSGNTVTIVKTGADTLTGPTSLAVGESVDVATDGVTAVYTMMGRASSGGPAGAVTASDVGAGEFPSDVSFAGQVAFKNVTSFAAPAFFNGAFVFQLTKFAAAGAARTLSFSSSVMQDITLEENCVISFGSATEGSVMEVWIRQDATGGRTITWPGTIRLPIGYSLNTAANGVTKVRICYVGSVHWLELLGKY